MGLKYSGKRFAIVVKRYIRERCGGDPTLLARRMGTTRAAIDSYVSGRRDKQLNTVLLFANATGLDAQAIFKELEEVSDGTST